MVCPLWLVDAADRIGQALATRGPCRPVRLFGLYLVAWGIHSTAADVIRHGSVRNIEDLLGAFDRAGGRWVGLAAELRDILGPTEEFVLTRDSLAWQTTTDNDPPDEELPQ